MGIGAMTDFGPLLARPSSLLLGAAAQLGIYIAFIVSRLLGFNVQEAASIGIIGGADGPTAIFLTTKLAPHLLPAITIAAYSYMALIPMIQPPIMRLLTTKGARPSWDKCGPFPKLKNCLSYFGDRYFGVAVAIRSASDRYADARQFVP